MSGPGTIRVGIVCPYSLRWPGGVQHHTLDLSLALRDLGVEADVVAPTDTGRHCDVPEFVPPPGVTVIPLGSTVPVSANGSTARLALSPLAAARTRQAVRSYDVVHVHEPLTPGVALTAVASSRAPVVGTFHAAAEGGNTGYRLARPVLSYAWRRLSARIAVSEAAAALVKPYFGDAVEIIPNAVETSRFREAEPHPDRGETSGPVVLFLGRKEPRKGLDIMVDAWPSVRDAVPDAELWLAGPGTEDVIGAGVRGFGAVDDATLAGLFSAADVYCSPARGGESFGIVLLEAMAAGTPVVATSIPGYAAVARDGREAVLVQRERPGLIADAVVKVLEDEEFAARLVEAGRARAAEFDWSHVATRIAQVYRRVLEDAAGEGHRFPWSL